MYIFKIIWEILSNSHFKVFVTKITPNKEND